MNLNKRVWTQAEIATRALEMLAIGNQAVHRAQARNRALGITNYYTVAGCIVSDAPQPNRQVDDLQNNINSCND